MSSPSQRKSTLARLLAKENITVQHGHYKTAFFDVKNRILGLPLWKTENQDVYDLLVGHEVGHALFTPVFKPEDFDFPMVYMNIIEDVRIEKMIQDTYPGLIRCFQSGYKSLFDSDFFQIQGRDLNALQFPDRINLKFKLRNQVNILFSDEEQKIVDLIDSAKTWEDVIDASKVLYEFMKSQKDEQKPDNSDQQERSSDIQSDGEQSFGDGLSSNDSEDEKPQSSNDSEDEKPQSTPNSELQNDQQGSSDDSEDKKEEKSEPQSKSDSEPQSEKEEKLDSPESIDSKSGTKPEHDDFKVETLEHLDKNLQENYLDKTLDRAFFVKEPSKELCRDAICSYHELFKFRDNSVRYNDMVKVINVDTKFVEFTRNMNKFVDILVKEFEMRKSAYQYSRAKVSKVGKLDLSKLHRYKTDDDIFLSVSQLANAKSHGMIMFVDYSGSMRNILPDVLHQVITLVTFCKKINIPFQVFGFASKKYYDESYKEKLTHGDINSCLTLLELVSSKMSKSDYSRAILDLYKRSENISYSAEIEDLHSTPLDETLIFAHRIVKEFQSEHNIEKTNVVFLTDGDSNSIYTYSDASHEYYETETRYTRYNYVFHNLNGRSCKSESGYFTSALIENLKITTGCKMIGFFIPNSMNKGSFYRYYRIASPKSLPYPFDEDSKIYKKYRENKVAHIPGGKKYDDYFIVASGRELAAEDDHLEITENMSRGRIAKEFMNYNRSKKINRVLATKFAEAIS